MYIIHLFVEIIYTIGQSFRSSNATQASWELAFALNKAYLVSSPFVQNKAYLVSSLNDDWDCSHSRVPPGLANLCWFRCVASKPSKPVLIQVRCLQA